MATHDNTYSDTLYKVSIETPEGVVDLVGASYAGVPFFVDTASTAGGRNVVTKALPFSGNHVNEDTGLKVREFPVTFYLLGSDVESKRADLETAFNKEGAFEFVHPYYGKFFARCNAYSLEYNKSEIEYVSGSATFVPESEVKNAGKAVTDLRGVTISKSDDSLSAAKSHFTEAFSLAKKAKSVVDSVADFTSGVLDDIETARSSIRSVSEFVNTVSQIRDNIQLALMTPSDFASRIQNLLTMTAETLKIKEGSSSKSLFNGYVNESIVSMSSCKTASEIDSANIAADSLSAEVSRLVLMSSASMAVRSVVDCEFASVEEAEAMQDAVTDAFDEALGKVDDADDYTALVDMESSALKYLRDTMSKLAVIVEFPLTANRDALSVCFDCYGSLDKLDDVIERNSIADPMVINREKLKVLSE